MNIPETIYIGNLDDAKLFSLEWYRSNEWGYKGVEYSRVVDCEHELRAFNDISSSISTTNCGRVTHTVSDHKFCPYCGGKVKVLGA